MQLIKQYLLFCWILILKTKLWKFLFTMLRLTLCCPCLHKNLFWNKICKAFMLAKENLQKFSQMKTCSPVRTDPTSPSALFAMENLTVQKKMQQMRHTAIAVRTIYIKNTAPSVCTAQKTTHTAQHTILWTSTGNVSVFSQRETLQIHFVPWTNSSIAQKQDHIIWIFFHPVHAKNMVNYSARAWWACHASGL